MPGLNAPIPPGTQFGYQAGGWGKPPVNEAGEPLYGDVFGQFADEEDDEQVWISSAAQLVKSVKQTLLECCGNRRIKQACMVRQQVCKTGVAVA